MKTIERNGNKLKGMCGFLYRTGQGVKMAAGTGYKTGYFMAKHPQIEMVKDELRKNYKQIGIIALLGLGLSFLGIIKLILDTQQK